MRQQRQPSYNGGSCLYRGPGGLKCAMGALIPDAIMNAGYEHSGIRSLLRYHDEIATFFDGVDKRLLSELQNAHDSNSPLFVVGAAPDMYMRAMEHDFRLIADKYKLAYTPEGQELIAPIHQEEKELAPA